MVHLWHEVKGATDEGVEFDRVKERLSIDTEFSYLKTWDLYKESGDSWVKDDFNKILQAFWIQLHPVIGSYIQEFIDQNGPEKGIAELKNILMNKRKAYYISEAGINQLGYRLISKKMNDAAIEVFKINADLYPDSGEVYDSLGEAYLKSGQKDLAIKNYEISLQLNPQNKHALDMLNKIRR